MDFHKDFLNFMVSSNKYVKEKKLGVLVTKSLHIAAFKQLVSLDLQVAS